MTAPKPEANSLSSVDPGGATCTFDAVSGLSVKPKMLRTKEALLSPSAQTAIFLTFFRSSKDLIFLAPGLSSSTTSCSRIAIARARGGIFESVRNTIKSASRRSNCATAFAPSPAVTIFSFSRELLLLSTAPSLAAKRASSPLGPPTAKMSVSEFFRRMRPPHTVASDNTRVNTVNSSICRRLLLTTCERGGGW